MLFSAMEYKTMREGYCYYDRVCRFEIVATDGLHRGFAGKYEGVFPKTVPHYYSHGINLRRFEMIVKAVFAAAGHAESKDAITAAHISNLKEIICAVVHWKMASQGGRV